MTKRNVLLVLLAVVFTFLALSVSFYSEKVAGQSCQDRPCEPLPPPSQGCENSQGNPHCDNDDEEAPTDVPEEPTDTPEEPTDVPEEPTDVPEEPTDVPVENTPKPEEPEDPEDPEDTPEPGETPEPGDTPESGNDPVPTNTPRPTPTATTIFRVVEQTLATPGAFCSPLATCSTCCDLDQSEQELNRALAAEALAKRSMWEAIADAIRESGIVPTIILGE